MQLPARQKSAIIILWYIIMHAPGGATESLSVRQHRGRFFCFDFIRFLDRLHQHRIKKIIRKQVQT